MQGPRTPELTPAQKVINLLGGISAVSKELGHPFRTTVQYWYDNGRIPNWRLAEIKELAARKGVRLPKELLTQRKSA